MKRMKQNATRASGTSVSTNNPMVSTACGLPVRILSGNPAKFFPADEAALLRLVIALDEIVGREGVVHNQSGDEQDHRDDQNRAQQKGRPDPEYPIFFVLLRHRSDSRERAPAHLGRDQQKNYYENGP